MDSSIGDVILNNVTRMYNWYFVRIDGGGSEFDIKKFNLSRSCGSNRTIQLQCTPKTCGLSTVPTVGAYIIGGDVVQKEVQWPFMAALMRHNKHICGGTLVHERFVLTAAHCFVFSSTDDKHRPMFDHPNHFSVRLGSTKNIGSTKHLQVIRVEKIHIYHLYNFNDNKYNLDIALVELEKPATLNDYIATACLPKPEEKAPLCYGLGWGYTNIDDFGIDPVIDLRQVKLQELDPEVCKTLDASYVNDATKLCVSYLTNSIKPCHGDSGGPLICRHPSGRWLVRGLVSSGSDDYGSCASPNGVKPTMFTNVVDFIDWIQTIIKSAK
ncbi:hypothetical protein HELRODRAFT_100540 [Helobdella robusta]|uniref:Peptidase S1 domain-containing protein n=1 Tax=Helobdella robusta TaxID=6412 RepID=T1ED03_HELRO|nr:hypothetical protein HELRODRAFT_100540 [Helobdella robusta]ESO01754.1 hypothetical protein HELRODRAFT_100540 [Helobdella robusta]